MLNQFVIYAAQGAMALAALLLIGILFQRLVHQISQRQLARGIEVVLPLMFQYIQEDLSLKSFKVATSGNRRALKHLLLILVPQLEGSLRIRLRKAAEEMGFVHQAMREAASGKLHRAEYAAMQLGLWRSEESTPVLVNLLRSPSREVRFTAARSLALIGSTEEIRILLDVMHNPNLIDTSRVLEMMQQMPRPDVGPFVEAIRNEETPLENRLMLIDMLGDVREHRIIPVLREMLWNKSAELVLHSIKALTRIGDIDGLPIMLELIDHPRWEIRAQVVKAVGALGFTEGIGLMQAALADHSYWVRWNAAATLAALGGEALGLLDPQQHTDRFAQDMVRYQRQRVGLNGHLGESKPSLPAVPDREAVEVRGSV